jgi:hypothetical protein
MTRDNALMRKLRVKLVEKQATLQEGDRVLIQPRIERMHVEARLTFRAMTTIRLIFICAYSANSALLIPAASEAAL